MLEFKLIFVGETPRDCMGQIGPFDKQAIERKEMTILLLITAYFVGVTAGSYFPGGEAIGWTFFAVTLGLKLWFIGSFLTGFEPVGEILARKRQERQNAANSYSV